jgi:hypothetical protein
MLIPRFSLRWLLGLITLSAGVSVVLAQAVRGQSWAIGVSAALLCLIVLALLQAGTFLVAWLVALAEAAAVRRTASILPASSPGECPFQELAPTPPMQDGPPAMTG